MRFLKAFFPFLILVMAWPALGFPGRVGQGLALPYYGIPGTEGVTVFHRDGYTCYRYQSCCVTVSRSEGGAAAEIRVTAAGEKDQPVCAGETTGDNYQVSRGDSGTFSGVRGDLLFLESGDETSGRHLVIHDLKKRQRVFDSPYVPPAKILGERLLTFWKPMGEAYPWNCSEYDAFLAMELLPIAEVQLELDLNTLKSRETGKTRCKGLP